MSPMSQQEILHLGSMLTSAQSTHGEKTTLIVISFDPLHCELARREILQGLEMTLDSSQVKSMLSCWIFRFLVEGSSL